MLNLSPKEKLVLQHFDTGLGGKEIAAQLRISPHTVRSYMRSIVLKTGASSMRQAAFKRRRPDQV